MATTKVGLVLGAGGVVGQAYHAGVLAALEHDLGWDPRTAGVIVGSSAGSVTGTLLRLGVSAADLASWAVESPMSVDAGPIVEQLSAERPDFPPMSPLDVARRWRLPSVALLARAARRPWAFRPSVAAMTLLPAGRVDITDRTAALEAAAGGEWPDGLWICAARRTDGQRVVFGRPGSPPASLGRAVAASCAIPAYFCPVEIGGVEYFDGGVHSSTSADVLRGSGLDLVIVLAPMSAAHGRSTTADAPVRWATHRRIDHEVGRLRSAGTTVVRFEPGARTLRAMGLNAMDAGRTARVVQQAFLEAGRVAAQAAVADKLAPVSLRPRRRSA